VLTHSLQRMVKELKLTKSLPRSFHVHVFLVIDDYFMMFIHYVHAKVYGLKFY
jgi:hypothetical protein